MASSNKPEDVFLEAIRHRLGQPELSLENVTSNPIAKILFQSLADAGEAASVDEAERPMSAFSTSTPVIKAAIEDTFDLTTLSPNDAERGALLAASDLVMIAGSRRLRLHDTKRGELLAASRGTEPYEGLLRTAVTDDEAQRDAIGGDVIRSPSAWLRRFLAGQQVNMDAAPPRELKAALEARQRLQSVSPLPSTVPSVADLSRRVGLAQLLEPLRVLVGAQGGWGDTPATDRFVGREEPMRQLRAFVDELSSRSVGEFLDRSITKFKKAVSGAESTRLLFMTARGGLGKSTLCAKFVLDHAVGQSRQFPFAYLDFDRAGIDPERPRQLLLEIARQVALQFPDAQTQLDALCDDIRAESVRPTADATAATASDIKDPFAQFVEILRQHATAGGSRAFLLVLDTLEIVQWDASAMDKLAELVDQFRRKGLTELRVVASGRAEVPELRRKARGATVSAEQIKLKPLTVKEARQMAQALGTASIGADWNASWSNAIAGTATDNDVRREPLAVRVAVDLVAREEPAKRAGVIEEIQKSGVEAADDFVARLYENRILNHIRDPRAEKLAWPGLVVRRLTIEIVREVLAPIRGMSPEEAEAAFRALGQEIWMVEREDAAGNVLRHRPDLRARTLPLMKRKKPEDFAMVARAAVAYFEKHRDRSREDRAEWIYHRLLLGEAPESVERDVDSDLLRLLVRAEDDFPTDSAAASYIAARTARVRLPPKRIRALRPNDALYHLSVRSVDAFALDDVTIDPVVLEVSDSIAKAATTISPDLRNWAHALWIKTGSWSRVSVEPFVSAADNVTFRAGLFWAARTVRQGPQAQQGNMPPGWLGTLMLPTFFNRDTGGFRTTVQALALARMMGTQAADAFERLDAQLTTMLATMKPNPTLSTQAALRTAIVLGDTCRYNALRLWIESRRRGSAENIGAAATISTVELDMLFRVHPPVRAWFSGDVGKGPKGFVNDETVATALRAIEEAMGDPTSPEAATRLGGLSQVFACRDEDWIVPLGYAAERAGAAKAWPVLSRYLSIYGEAFDAPTDDLVWAMRLADENGDLSGFSRLALSQCPANSPQTAEFRSLLDLRNTWRVAIGDIIGTGADHHLNVTASASPDQPPTPPPGVHPDDPQKDRWGGQDQRDGRVVRAVLESVEDKIFYFTLNVESTDDSPLESPVVFHLHDSYPQSVITITRIEGGKRATLREWNAYGVFAIGVQVKNGKGQWTALELDLATLRGLPQRFLSR